MVAVCTLRLGSKMLQLCLLCFRFLGLSPSRLRMISMLFSCFFIVAGAYAILYSVVSLFTFALSINVLTVERRSGRECRQVEWFGVQRTPAESDAQASQPARLPDQPRSVRAWWKRPWWSWLSRTRSWTGRVPWTRWPGWTSSILLSLTFKIYRRSVVVLGFLLFSMKAERGEEERECIGKALCKSCVLFVVL